jgi:flagellar basal body-associated protein FliL
MNKDEVTSRPRREWLRAEDYMETLARRRTARRARASKSRTQPEAPRVLLSTLPFIALMVGLAVLTLGIVIAAWPVSSAKPPRQAEQAQLGTASKGWYQEAEKQFR